MTIQISQPTTLPGAEQVIELVNKLQLELQQSLPQYESSLHIIHKMLSENEDMIHMLSEDQVGIIIAGLSKRKNIVVVEEKTAKVKKGGKVSMSDLI